MSSNCSYATHDQPNEEMDQVMSAEHLIFWNQDLPIPKSLADELEQWKRLWSNVDDSETIPDNFV